MKEAIAKILLQDQLFRLEIYRRIASSDYIRKEELQQNQENLRKLEPLWNQYKDLARKQPDSGNDAAEWLANVQELIKSANEDMELLQSPPFAGKIDQLNGAIKAGHEATEVRTTVDSQ